METLLLSLSCHSLLDEIKVGRNRQGTSALLNYPFMNVLVRFGRWSHVRCRGAACFILLVSCYVSAGQGGGRSLSEVEVVVKWKGAKDAGDLRARCWDL